MRFEGHADFASESVIRGWVYDRNSPNARVTIEIVAGSRVIATLLADQPRADLSAAGKGDGKHAFAYGSKEPSLHGPLKARVIGKRWNLPQSGVPVETIPAPMRHETPFGCPEFSHGFSVGEPSPDEPQIVRRLIDAYHLAVRDDPFRPKSQADTWSDITRDHHAEIIALLQSRDVAGVSSYLRDAHTKGITHGIMQGPDDTLSLRRDPLARRNVACSFLDALVSLAEFIGVLDAEYPHGRVCDNLYSDPDELVERIGQSLGVSVVRRPVIGSAFGLCTRKGGYFAGRDLYSLYAAIRLRDICNQTGITNPSVCELGGGLGGVGYYAAQLGIRRFTIIDLPVVNVLQGYFLLSSLPQTQVCLYGESQASDDAFHVLPTWMFNRPEPVYDILFNQDSMPEMHETYGLGYLRQARRNVKYFFLSCNHEARDLRSGNTNVTVVRDLTDKVGGYERISRCRHWLNVGYVEELFRITPADSSTNAA